MTSGGSKLALVDASISMTNFLAIALVLRFLRASVELPDGDHYCVAIRLVLGELDVRAHGLFLRRQSSIKLYERHRQGATRPVAYSHRGDAVGHCCDDNEVACATASWASFTAVRG